METIMKLIKVFDDDDINPKSAWAYLKGDRLILKEDFVGFKAGSYLIVNSKNAINMRETFEFNWLLKKSKINALQSSKKML